MVRIDRGIGGVKWLGHRVHIQPNQAHLNDEMSKCFFSLLFYKGKKTKQSACDRISMLSNGDVII